MRVANVKEGRIVQITKPQFVDLDKMPCVYADLEKADKRKDWKWKVGCKFFGYGKDIEYSFKISKIGDVDNEKFWLRSINADFAIELVSVFKDGGELALKEWIKNGCP